jgi:signal transduction histidine kinase
VTTVGTPGPPQPPESPGEDLDRERRTGFLGFVAHEVRNPLSTALWTAEMLARMSTEERGGPRGEKLSAMCLRSLGRVRQLVEDHFVIERFDAGGLPVRPEPLALREIVEAVLARSGIAATVAVDADADGVLADRTLLERALEATARAAARDGAPVLVEARPDRDAVRIRIEGAPAASDALEDPRKGAQSDPKSSALGLAASRRIAAALGGSLAVDGGAFLLVVPRSGPDGDGADGSMG